ncbi:MAG: hypothetical protein IPN92_05235 [Chromatiaceae bacterium]|nr:hypothetical protein [Chromatiaceae bacterium]
MVLDLWFECGVRPSCRRQALLCRYADDFFCAFRFPDDAERFFKVLPQRLAKFSLEVAPEKTQVLRFIRFNPSMTRWVIFIGFEWIWFPDREGTPRVKRRTARKKPRGAVQRLKDWIKGHRRLPGRDFIKGLNRRRDGHYNHYGLRGQLAGLVALLPDGDGVGVQMAESARRQAQALYLAGVQPRLSEARHREAPHH